MPTPGRPALPASYGIKPSSQGRLIQWDAVEARLKGARNYRVAMSSPQGRSHVSPVWGIWHQGAFYFGTDPRSRKGRNLAANPSAIVDLESGDDVAVVEGDVRKLPPVQITSELDASYSQKYGFRLRGNDVYKVAPRRVFAWAESDFPESATRWRF